LFGVNAMLGLSVALSWLIVAWFFRYSSLAALVAAVFAPVYYVFGGDVVWPYAEPLLCALIVMGLLLVWRHLDNINRLVAGTESKLGAKKK
jgi:glycerol-3-phosphate acyltransferase PlsY